MEVPNHILVAMVVLTICATTTLALAPPPLQPRSSSTTTRAPAPAPAHLGAPMIPVYQSKPNDTEEFLKVHNKARAEVKVHALKWSSVLAKDTSKLVRYQRDYKKCEFADMKLTKYGMNQMWASGMKVTPSGAVNLWLQSKKYYNHTTNTCAPHHSNCGVYKQVVWNKTLEVGCAQAKCKKQHSTLTICLYHPPGNVIGERPF